MCVVLTALMKGKINFDENQRSDFEQTNYETQSRLINNSLHEINKIVRCRKSAYVAQEALCFQYKKSLQTRNDE